MDSHRRSLLDSYADAAVGEGNALAVTVTRTRSPAGRDLLAYLASRRRLLYSDLVEEVSSIELSSPSAASTLSQRYDSEWLAYLGQVIAVQSLDEKDRGHAIKLYEVLEALVRRIHLSARDAKLFADLLMTEGRSSDVASRIWDLPVTERDRTQLRADLANPFIGGAESAPAEVWMTLFESALGYSSSQRLITLDDGSNKLAFDRLCSKGVPRISRGPLVSVIVTTFKPDEGLITAARSILEQSWQSIELLVVDDGSPSEYEHWLERVEGLDSRVRVVRLEDNGGTYQARNVGLAIATGDYATFQDSDDWSHPRRIETQVRPLIEDGDLVATSSTCVRASPDLALTSTGYQLFRFNTSSLMIRLKSVLGKVGFMDHVRKAADTEYLKRIEVAFAGGYQHLDESALSVVRLVPDSLSRSEFRPGWHHPARILYREGYQSWHERLDQGESPYLDMMSRTRPFPAPARFLSAETRRRHFDVVLVADWRESVEPPVSLLEELVEEHGAASVAIGHMESYLDLASHWPRPYAFMHRLARCLDVALVDLDDSLQVETLLVTLPEILQFPGFRKSAWDVGTFEIHAAMGPVDSSGFTRYHATSCHETATRIFGVAPRWIVKISDVASTLEDHLGADSVSTSFPTGGRAGRDAIVG